MSSARPLRPEPDMAKLVKLPAWERAKVYDAANLGLAERSIVEAEDRARMAREYRRRA